jgi:pseudaminic acid cytidylyltransferase
LPIDLFDEVMVSTDDEEIAEVAERYGAKVPFFRSAETSNDFATTMDVLLEVIGRYEAKELIVENACCIYPAAPLIQVESLVEGYSKLRDQNRDAVFPVVPFSYPIWRGLRESQTGRIEMVWPEHSNSRSQDLEEVFHDAGQWYWFKVESVKRYKTLFSENTAAVKLDPITVQDIDQESDWMMAKIKYEYLQSSK